MAYYRKRFYVGVGAGVAALMLGLWKAGELLLAAASWVVHWYSIGRF